MHRSLSDDYIQALVATRFWQGICGDEDLFPEIRADAVTVYYRGAALIRNLRLDNGKFTGTTHPKYVPLSSGAKNRVEFASDGGGLYFATPVEACPLGDANADILQAYKGRMSRFGGPESKVIHATCLCPGNVIVDQEIAFQTSLSDSRDKIDLLSFDPMSSTYSFVEVKGITDSRLREGTDGLREVVQQLSFYGERIQSQAESIRTAIDRIVTLKSHLGLGSRIASCQGVAVNQLLAKPILMIGGCNRQEVQDILSQNGHWASLLDCLKDVAAGLIVCGNDGARLDLSEGRGRHWFDQQLMK